MNRTDKPRRRGRNVFVRSRTGVGRARARRARRGAVALEYILIAGLVAIGLIGAFRIWGQTVQWLFRTMAWDSSGALVSEDGLG